MVSPQKIDKIIAVRVLMLLNKNLFQVWRFSDEKIVVLLLASVGLMTAAPGSIQRYGTFRRRR